MHAHAGIAWTAGALYTDAELEEYKARAATQKEAEAERLRTLRGNEELPLVWMDVALKGKALGRVEMVLFLKESPRAAENMRQMCSGG